MRRYGVSVLLLLFAINVVQGEDSNVVDLGKIDRKIVNEPKYKNEPHYALIVLGLQAQHRSWLVMDGDEVLYIDRNGNGDLTDPEDRIECDKAASAGKVVSTDNTYLRMDTFTIGTIAGAKLKFMYWVRNKSAMPKDELTRKYLREREMNNWENGTLWRIAEDAGQAQNPILLAATPAAAQISHLDGPLTFCLKWKERQRLQAWPKVTVFDINIGTFAFPAQNYSHKVFSPLTEHEFPRDIHPLAVFQFPPVKPGDPPIIQEIELNERCCGDTAYMRFTVPEKVGPGKVKVTLTYPGWRVRDVQPATFEILIEPEVES
ncbi:MAG: hypothetical protein V4719_06305 [Planctomycetota bacterium]